MLEFARQHFYHIFSSIWGKLSRNLSLLLISEISGLFVNTLTADDKYCLRNLEKYLQSIKMQLFKRESFFPIFLFHY